MQPLGYIWIVLVVEWSVVRLLVLADCFYLLEIKRGISLVLLCPELVAGLLG